MAVVRSFRIERPVDRVDRPHIVVASCAMPAIRRQCQLEVAVRQIVCLRPTHCCHPLQMNACFTFCGFVCLVDANKSN